jgi:hypothetical protein
MANEASMANRFARRVPDVAGSNRACGTAQTSDRGVPAPVAWTDQQLSVAMGRRTSIDATIAVGPPA